MFAIYKSPQGPQPLVPDVLIDFSDGYGIPEANGGIGGPGSQFVQIISPQDSGNGARLVRAPRYWDPQAEWRQGEPIFVPKQADRLVGWPGPRTGGYWTGPMPNMASTSQTVMVYGAAAGRTVSVVAGGVVGPTALRVDIAAGQDGDAWSASFAPSLMSGWAPDPDGNKTVCYMHAVVELLGNISDHKFRFGVYDSGAGAFIDSLLVQRYDEPNQQRIGKTYRGIGPHGGHLYEIWGLVRVLTAPVGPLFEGVWLLLSGSGSNPARTVIVHGRQSYFYYYLDFGISDVPPFFSHATGAPVAWTAEDVRLLNVTGAYTFASKFRVKTHESGATLNYGRLLSRNSVWHESWFHYAVSSVRSCTPYWDIGGFNGKLVGRVDANYSRAAIVDGTNVLTMVAFDNPAANPSYLALGNWGNIAMLYGRMDRFLLWRRSLTDTEMLKAWRAL